jgi:hypothetical protein
MRAARNGLRAAARPREAAVRNADVAAAEHRAAQRHAVAPLVAHSRPGLAPTAAAAEGARTAAVATAAQRPAVEPGAARPAGVAEVAMPRVAAATARRVAARARAAAATPVALPAAATPVALLFQPPAARPPLPALRVLRNPDNPSSKAELLGRTGGKSN